MVSEKVFHMLCTAILGNLKYVLYKAINHHNDGKYMHKYLKSILQKLGSNIYSFIFGNKMTVTIGGWGN